MLLRLAAIGIVIASVVGAFAYTGGWFSPHRLTPARFIDTFEKLNGLHPEAWLAGVIDRVANGHPINRRSELLPWNWTRQSAKLPA